MSPPDDPREKFRRPLERPSINLPVPTRADAPVTSSQLPVPVVVNPGGAEDGKDDSSGGLSRLLGAISKMLNPNRDSQPAEPQAPAPAAGPVEPTIYTVLVAAMNGDSPDGAASHALFKALDGRKGLRIKPLPRTFQFDSIEDPSQVLPVLASIRQSLMADSADLMIWGSVAAKDGYSLRLTGMSPLDDERPGAFGLATRVDLPNALNEAQINLLYGAILAAGEPSTEMQRAAIRRMLPSATAPVEGLALKPPVALSMNQQRSAQLAFAHMCAACALAVPPSQADEWFQKSVDFYRAAEKRLGRNDAYYEAAFLHKHLAAVLTARAEKSKERKVEFLEQAVVEWRAAAQTLRREAMPQEWASAQARFGVTLYRLDLKTGNVELLRQAVTALQSALQVYTRTEAPHRWADIMHNVAQVLEVYGDQLKNPEVLQRAISACRSVMEIRTRERWPLAWAATSNTLASALFMLNRHTGDSQYLLQAAQCFEDALEIFRAFNAKGPAQVSARNLERVRAMAEKRRSAPPTYDPYWANS